MIPNKQRCIVIGEVAQAHDGSLGMAHSYIDAIARSGADAVKFQTHIAAEESTDAEPWRTKFSPQDVSRYDYWQRMQFTEEQWVGLLKHAEEKGLLFLSSPFSLAAVRLLQNLGVKAWKIPSGELGNIPLLKAVAATGKPVYLSSGMSNFSELDKAVDIFRSANIPLIIMQCTSAYPCPPEKVGIHMLRCFQERYEDPVGLSDHSGTIYPALAAVILGACVVEVHVTYSREMFGPDTVASVTIEELKNIVQGVRFIEKMMRNTPDKDELAAEMTSLREIFTKSIVARMSLPAGIVLEAHHLSFKKPGTGLPPGCMDDLVGRRLHRSLAKDEMINEGDLEKIP